MDGRFAADLLDYHWTIFVGLACWASRLPSHLLQDGRNGGGEGVLNV